jgi:hypothetical protein
VTQSVLGCNLSPIGGVSGIPLKLVKAIWCGKCVNAWASSQTDRSDATTAPGNGCMSVRVTETTQRERRGVPAFATASLVSGEARSRTVLRPRTSPSRRPRLSPRWCRSPDDFWCGCPGGCAGRGGRSQGLVDVVAGPGDTRFGTCGVPTGTSVATPDFVAVSSSAFCFATAAATAAACRCGSCTASFSMASTAASCWSAAASVCAATEKRRTALAGHAQRSE